MRMQNSRKWKKLIHDLTHFKPRHSSFVTSLAQCTILYSFLKYFSDLGAIHELPLQKHAKLFLGPVSERKNPAAGSLHPAVSALK